MPYTISHIGYILPFYNKWKKKLSISGLVFGSIAPDFDILFRLTNIRFHIFQYNALTIFLVIYPLALISAIVFHLFVRNILIDHLPSYFQAKYQHNKSFNFVSYFQNHLLKVSLSIFFAIYLHLFLDFICHYLNAYRTSILVANFTNNSIIISISYYLAIYFLPVLFSIVGFYLIFIEEKLNKLRISNLHLTKQARLFWLIIILNTVLFSIFKFYITQSDETFIIDYIIINITPSILIALYVTCFFYFLHTKLKTA